MQSGPHPLAGVSGVCLAGGFPATCLAPVNAKGRVRCNRNYNSREHAAKLPPNHRDGGIRAEHWLALCLLCELFILAPAVLYIQRLSIWASWAAFRGKHQPLKKCHELGGMFRRAGVRESQDGQPSANRSGLKLCNCVVCMKA